MLLVSFPEASDQQLKLEKGRRRWQTPCLTRATYSAETMDKRHSYYSICLKGNCTEDHIAE